MSAVDTRVDAPTGWRALVRVFNANKISWIGFVLLILILAVAALAPVLTRYDPFDQNVLRNCRDRHPPTCSAPTNMAAISGRG